MFNGTDKPPSGEVVIGQMVAEGTCKTISNMISWRPWEKPQFRSGHIHSNAQGRRFNIADLQLKRWKAAAEKQILLETLENQQHPVQLVGISCTVPGMLDCKLWKGRDK